MIIILHGDHVTLSRDRLIELKSDARTQQHDIIDIDGTKTDLSELAQSLESQSLFTDMRSVFIENLLSNLRPGKTRDQIISYLISHNFDTHLILWEKKPVGRQIMKLKKQPHVTVEEFKMPTVIFNFIDSLVPGNQDNARKQYQATLTNKVVPEIIFSMIVRQFRIMIALTVDAPVSETKRMAPWQKGKTGKQAQLFSLEKLKKHYKELLIIDFQIKTGQSPLDLTKRIEQFIMGL